MMVTHITLDDNETGVTADLTFTAKTSCVEEGRQIWQPGTRRTLDNTRFAQYGRWSGQISFDGQTLEVDADTTTGVKDRSWGIRPVGEPDPAGAPASDFAGFWFLWNPMHWDDHCSHIGLFLEPDGRPWHVDAAVVPSYASLGEVPGVSDPATKHFHHVTQDIDWLPGTRWARFAELTMAAHDGTTKEIELEPVLRFHMKGIGYSHPDWGHGRWKGELAMESEVWKTADLDPLSFENLHVQQVVKGTSDGQTGVGALEQLVIGSNAAGNFTDLLDGARVGRPVAHVRLVDRVGRDHVGRSTDDDDHGRALRGLAVAGRVLSQHLAVLGAVGVVEQLVLDRHLEPGSREARRRFGLAEPDRPAGTTTCSMP